MTQTNVKELAANEFEVLVTVSKEEFDQVYNAELKRLSAKVKLPGFRPGKTPVSHIKKQFGATLQQDTIQSLIEANYIPALESSGLSPAVQPVIDIPADQPEEGFAFTMVVTTWPEVEVADLAKLSFEETTVEAGDADVNQVVERLMKSQVKFEVEDDRVAENGDQLHIDFVGSIDGEEFDGGKGEDVPLVLGEGRFIPGFEEQLIGAKAGSDVSIEVTFPEQYQAAHLAGKAAVFATTVKSVGKPVQAEDEDALAKMLGFDDGAALRADAQTRLNEEASQASFDTTREAALNALLEANAIELPQALIEQDMRETTQRVLQNMKRQGMEVPDDMLKDEEFNAEVRSRSERGLKLSVLLQKLRADAGLVLDDEAVEAELDRQSQQYPEAQREQFKTWMRSQKEQLASIKDALLERRCIEYVVSKAKTKAVSKALSVWQEEQEA